MPLVRGRFFCLVGQFLGHIKTHSQQTGVSLGLKREILISLHPSYLDLELNLYALFHLKMKLAN